MLSLPFRKITLSYPELLRYSEAFPRSIVCYARHQFDGEYVLPMAMEFDFLKGEVTCFDSFSEPNRCALAAVPNNPFSIGLNRLFDPHWFVRLNDGTYLMFFQRRRYFYRFRPEESRFDAVFPEDIGLPPEVDEFWATNFLHPDGSVTFIVHETYANRNRYSIYRSNPEFDRFELVHSGYTKSGNIPHVVVPYWDGYLLSDFYYNEFRFVGDPSKRRLSEGEILTAAYSKLFSEFAKERRESLVFSDFCKKSPKGMVPVGDFADYVRKTFADAGCKSIKEYCDTTAYRFEPFPGEITYVEPERGVETVFETTCSNPAHFEVDGETGEVYVSSHNFNYLNRNVLEYFWPAAIDRFVPDAKSVLRKAETFSAPDGYRFTSHRVVRSNRGKKIVTFGQPNRFFSISAPEFESVSRLDVMPNRLSECFSDASSTMRYLRREGSDESVTVKALEASEDGSWTVFAVSSDSTFFIDSNTEDGKEAGYSQFSLPFPPDWAGNSEKGVFVCRTTHVNYVR